MIELLAAAALLLGQTPPEPAHLRRTEQGLVVDTPGDPEMITFELTARPASEHMSLRSALERALGDEPYEIVSLDEASGRITVRSSQWGGLALSGSHANLHVSDLSPQVSRIEPSCHYIQASLDEGDEDFVVLDFLIPCPPAAAVEGGESLVIAGLDARGRQLWVTSADDPRTHQWETFAADGPSHTTWRNEEDPVWASLRVPVTEDLDRLRWFEVTEDDRLVLLGESSWRPAQD